MPVASHFPRGLHRVLAGHQRQLPLRPHTPQASHQTNEKKKGEAATKGKPGRKPKAAPGQAVEGYLAPPPKPQASGGESDLLAAMEAMKPLVAALGADKVKRIADLLS